ncbi:MAG: hypothetical protein R3C32_01765 [Chloroflexota bacterium]
MMSAVAVLLLGLSIATSDAPVVLIFVGVGQTSRASGRVAQVGGP